MRRFKNTITIYHCAMCTDAERVSRAVSAPRLPVLLTSRDACTPAAPYRTAHPRTRRDADLSLRSCVLAMLRQLYTISTSCPSWFVRSNYSKDHQSNEASRRYFMQLNKYGVSMCEKKTARADFRVALVLNRNCHMKLNL